MSNFVENKVLKTINRFWSRYALGKIYDHGMTACYRLSTRYIKFTIDKILLLQRYQRRLSQAESVDWSCQRWQFVGCLRRSSFVWITRANWDNERTRSSSLMDASEPVSLFWAKLLAFYFVEDRITNCNLAEHVK